MSRKTTLRRVPRTSPACARFAQHRFDFSHWTRIPVFNAGETVPAIAGNPGVLERCVALLLLALALPFLLFIAVAIKVESPRGPVFYRQERVGLDRRRRHRPARTDSHQPHGAVAVERRKTAGTGQRFRIWKFRTMIPDAEAKTGPIWASANDPRITRVGRALRYLRFDELPQLINVIAGHMRLIGPRPERPQFVEQLCKTVPEYERRHTVPPGITGLAQVLRHYDSTLDDVKTKLKYDLFYVDHRGVRMNLKILVKTLDVIVRGRGAH